MTDEIKKDTVDYRDPTPFDDTKLNSISEISKGIRHKYFGKDTREALAQQGEALVALMQETGGNPNAEVAAARGNHELLQMREDAQDNAIAQNATTLNNKFDTVEAQNYLKTITVVPETFANLAAIKAKYPSGANGLMVAADNGHKYIWTNGTWTDVGVYQSAGVADHSITREKLGVPRRMDVLSGGLMSININNRTVFIENRSTLETLDGDYVRIGEEDLYAAIPESTNPIVYFYVESGTELNSTITPRTLTSECIVVAAIYNDKLVYPTHFENIEFVGNGSAKYKVGTIIGSDILIDLSAKTVTIPKNSFIQTNNEYFTYSADSETVIDITNAGSSTLYYDHHDRIFKLKSNSGKSGQYAEEAAENNLVKIATIFDGCVYPMSSESRIMIVNAKNTKTEISYLLNDIYIDENTKKVTVPAALMFTLNNSKKINETNFGDYYNISTGSGTAQTIDIPDRPSYRYLWHLYVDYTTKTYRVGFYKTSINEVLICTWFDGNVMDTLSPHKVIYNGVRGGKLMPKKPLTISEISNGLAKGEISTLCFYGDSTFAGATNGDPTNAFSALLGPMLSGEFGKTINVINGGHSGKSIDWLDTNFDVYFGSNGEYANAQVVIIGGGLNNDRSADGINKNKASLQSIVNKLKKLGKEAVIATTQATCLTLYTADQSPKYGRNQWGVYAYENSMRRDLAKENGLALLDFNKITSQFIMFSKYLETEICYDRLHFTDLGHKFEAGWLCSQFINRTITIDDDFLITPATHNIKSDVEWHAIENLSAMDENGFKSQIKLDDLTDGTLIYDTLIFNENKKPMQLKGYLNSGSVDVMINGEAPTALNADGQILLADMEMGYYHIQVRATGTSGNFKGLKIEQG